MATAGYKAPLWVRGAVFFAAAAVTCLLFINFCNLVYQCGCASLWAGAAAHCNIHTGPKRCPWCAIGGAGQFGVWLSILVPQALIAFGARLATPFRLAAAILAFPVFGALSALVVGLWQGYWN